MFECLSSLRSQSFQDFEIIVVDGKSNDETVAIANQFGARVLPEEDDLSRYRGKRALARNLGASQANGEILVFSDADCSFEEAWLSKVISEVGNGLDIVGGFDSPPIGSGRVARASALMEMPMRRNPKSGLAAAFVIKNCDMACRTSVFKKLGGFTEMEELDFCVRAVRLGYKVRYLPGIEVIHNRRPSLTSLFAEAWEANLTTNLRKTEPVSTAKYWYGLKDTLLGLGALAFAVTILISAVWGFLIPTLFDILLMVLAFNLGYFFFLIRVLGRQRDLWLVPIIVTVTTTLRSVAIDVGVFSRLIGKLNFKNDSITERVVGRQT